MPDESAAVENVSDGETIKDAATSNYKDAETSNVGESSKNIETAKSPINIWRY